jgi:hypothetical protein
LRAAGLALLLLASSGSAQGVVPSADATLRSLNEEGKRAFAEQRYVDALQAFVAAHERSGLPGYLFNIALAHRLLGHCDEAAAAYRKYLAAVPNAPNRAQAEQQLEVVTRCSAVPEPSPPAEPVQVAPAVPPAAVVVPTPEPPAAIKHGRRWPWVLTGGGVALAAVGAALALWADAQFNQLQHTCAPGCDPASWSGARLREQVSWPVLGVGALLAAIGAGLGIALPAE